VGCSIIDKEGMARPGRGPGVGYETVSDGRWTRACAENVHPPPHVRRRQHREHVRDVDALGLGLPRHRPLGEKRGGNGHTHNPEPTRSGRALEGGSPAPRTRDTRRAPAARPPRPDAENAISPARSVRRAHAIYCALSLTAGPDRPLLAGRARPRTAAISPGTITPSWRPSPRWVARGAAGSLCTGPPALSTLESTADLQLCSIHR